MLQSVDPRNQDLIVNIDGRLVHRDEAAVSPFDSAVQGGDAVWEGLRLYHGRIFRLEQHLQRLRGSARAMGFDIPDDDHLQRELARTLEANGMDDGVHIRLTITRGVKTTSGMDPRLNQSGPTLIILPEWKQPVYDHAGIRLITSSIRRFPPDCLDPKIHHANLAQSILAKMEANNAGADDAVMLDPRGFVAETNATNLFLVDGGSEPTLRTPRAVACPEGVTRGAVMEAAAGIGLPVVEEDLSLMQFFRADEVFCTGTMGEVVPVLAIDGRAIGDAAGPTTQRIAAAFRAMTDQEGTPIAAVA